MFPTSYVAYDPIANPIVLAAVVLAMLPLGIAGLQDAVQQRVDNKWLVVALLASGLVAFLTWRWMHVGIAVAVGTFLVYWLWNLRIVGGADVKAAPAWGLMLGAVCGYPIAIFHLCAVLLVALGVSSLSKRNIALQPFMWIGALPCLVWAMRDLTTIV